MAHVPSQSGVSPFGALALTSVVSARRAGARAAALKTAADQRGAAVEPDGGAATMAGSSLIFIFSGMSESTSWSWNAEAICLHAALCPRSDQSASWQALEQ